MNKRLGKPKKRLYFIFQHNYFSIKKHTFQSVSVDTVSRIFGHFCFVRWMENSSFARKRRFPRQRLIEKTQLKIIIQKQRRKKKKSQLVARYRNALTVVSNWAIVGWKRQMKAMHFLRRNKNFFLFWIKKHFFLFFSNEKSSKRWTRTQIRVNCE